jgi:N6-adenosine-specific RNA methylase IME4
MKKYKTILIDPPWHYGKWGASTTAKDRSGTDMPYQTMNNSEILSLPIRTLAAENCEVYLWTTQKYLPIAFECFARWKVKYSTTLTWCKSPMGTGQGGVYCPTTEFILHGRYGKMVKVKRLDTTWWHIKRTHVHSRKPEHFQEVIEGVSDMPRLEMFARRKRKDWDSWGNEVESDISLDLNEREKVFNPRSSI